MIGLSCWVTARPVDYMRSVSDGIYKHLSSMNLTPDSAKFCPDTLMRRTIPFIKTWWSSTGRLPKQTRWLVITMTDYFIDDPNQGCVLPMSYHHFTGLIK